MRTSKDNPLRPRAFALTALPAGCAIAQPSDSWRRECEKRGFTLARSARQHRDLQPLKERLLAIGGFSVCLQPDYQMDEILDRGMLLDGTRAVSRPGERNRCHKNAAILWDANPTDTILMTGYSLTSDGMWHQHSWAWDTTTGTILETTTPRIAYFGMVLTEHEARFFYRANQD